MSREARQGLQSDGLHIYAGHAQVMRRERLTDVLTNDRHFEQEGFRAMAAVWRGRGAVFL
jgi:hypothetical protein